MTIFGKFPSFNELVQDAFQTFKRFPGALICAFILTWVLIILTQHDHIETETTLLKLAMASALGIALQIVLATWCEKRGWSVIISGLIQLIGFVLLAAYYFSLPSNPDLALMDSIRFALLGIFLHFLVSFAPYLGENQLQGFWQYNKSLFLRILFSALYSAVLFIGLAIALLAAKELFDLDVPDKRFLQLWIIIAVAFNTWVFLAGIPKDLAALNQSDQYPKGLKVFAQYILLPLVGLYLLILYAYELKIIITWNWPKGLVSQLVLWFSAVGILSLLLLWPLREQDQHRWIKNYIKWFFRALIPLVVMLYLAITERIGDYGLTVNRYLVIAMATGLALTTLYFVFSKKKDIRLIPIILCIIALLSSYGPWNAFAVALHSQQGRLENLLTANNIWVNEALNMESPDISLDARKELSSIVAYLAEYHGASAFSKWLPDSSVARLANIKNRWTVSDSAAMMLRFDFTRRWDDGSRLNKLEYALSDSVPITIENYDRLFQIHAYLSDSMGPKDAYVIGNDTCSIWLSKKPPVLYLDISPKSATIESPLRYDLTDLFTKLAAIDEDSIYFSEEISPELNHGDFDFKIIMKEFSGNRINDSVEVNSYNAYVLFRKKPQ